jgi:two-component system KDP operon response regulator KdpE
MKKGGAKMCEQHKILYVEDNPDLLRLTREMLERRGYAVLTAATLAEAREQVALAPPDIILLDNNLPDGMGIDFLRELRKTSKIPVIMVTSLSGAAQMEALEAGCDDYVRKPYDRNDLMERIASLLAGGSDSRDAPA